MLLGTGLFFWRRSSVRTLFMQNASTTRAALSSDSPETEYVDYSGIEDVGFEERSSRWVVTGLSHLPC